MKWLINLHVTEKRWLQALGDTHAKKLVSDTLNAVPCNPDKPFEIAVVLANNDFVRNLNDCHRDRNVPTNILSYPTNDPNQESLGDLILAYETCCHEANEQKKQFAHHVAHLLIHGLLHLLGYDHQNDSDAEIMEQKEIRFLKTIGIDNPYEDTAYA